MYVGCRLRPGSYISPPQGGPQQVTWYSGCYLGELASDNALPRELDYTIKEKTVTMPPITSNDDGSTGNAKGKVFYHDVRSVKGKIKDVNNLILTAYMKIAEKEPNKMTLFTGTRSFDLFKPSADSWTAADKKQEIVEATSLDGLGGYYTLALGSDTKLYSRSTLKAHTPKLYDEKMEKNLASTYGVTMNYSDYNINYLPWAIYSEIQLPQFDSSLSENVFKRNQIEGNRNAFSSSNQLTNFNDTKFTGTHGSRIDLGAVLSIPGQSDYYYSDFESFKVLPTGYSHPAPNNADGAYYIWLNGDTGSPTRHTWNDTTTMVFCKGEKMTKDNWCIVYIKTYGVYAPCGDLSLRNPISSDYGVKGYFEKQTTLKDPTTDPNAINFVPITFAIHTHVFLPNEYARNSNEYWAYTPSAARKDNFTWKSAGVNTPFGNFNSYVPLIRDITKDKIKNHTKIGEYYPLSWKSSYTNYTYDSSTKKYKRSSKTTNYKHNFYANPITGVS